MTITTPPYIVPYVWTSSFGKNKGCILYTLSHHLRVMVLENNTVCPCLPLISLTNWEGQQGRHHDKAIQISLSSPSHGISLVHLEHDGVDLSPSAPHILLL